MSREGTGKVARATKNETQQAPAAVAARGLPWAIEAAGLMPRRRFARRLLLGEAQRGLEASQAGQAVVHLAVGQGDERLILLLEVGDHPVHLVENRPLLLLHELDARSHKLGLQGFELGVQLIAIGAGHFGVHLASFLAAAKGGRP